TYSKGAYPTATIPDYMSTYTAPADPYQVQSEIIAELSGLGFTNFTVVLEENISELTSDGVVWSQSHKGTQPLNVALIIKVELKND
ncbi:MAG: hypothetical protein PHN21_00230, partial [Erysipelotrichaceae bacterium]|nr:hypothetical protein [Erysipelotrichaceae bacterium]